MATYTVELRKITADYGLTEYPIFLESYRDKLNKSITEHFHYREIGYETVDMFCFKFRQRMNLIMPVYNQLYLSTLMEFDPLTTTKITTDSQGNGVDKGTANTSSKNVADSTSDSTAKARSVGSDFPQTQLSDTGDYATSATDSVSDSGVVSNAIDSGTQESEQLGERESTSHTTMEGYTSSPSELVLRYRDTLINVDLMVIAELESLFMQVWDNSDEHGDYPAMYPFGSYFGGLL